MTETSIGLAGVRVILKRAMHEIGIKMKPDVPNDELVRIVIEWDAPVAEMCDRWIMIAEGKPGLTDAQRFMMIAQADAARKIWEMEKRAGKIIE